MQAPCFLQFGGRRQPSGPLQRMPKPQDSCGLEAVSQAILSTSTTEELLHLLRIEGLWGLKGPPIMAPTSPPSRPLPRLQSALGLELLEELPGREAALRCRRRRSGRRSSSLRCPETSASRPPPSSARVEDSFGLRIQGLRVWGFEAPALGFLALFFWFLLL